MTNKQVFQQFLIRQNLVNRLIARNQSEFSKALRKSDTALLDVITFAIESASNVNMVSSTGLKVMKETRKRLIEVRREHLDPLTTEFLDEMKGLVVNQWDFNRTLAEDTDAGEDVDFRDPSKTQVNNYIYSPMDGRVFNDWWTLFYAGDADRVMARINGGIAMGETESEIYTSLKGTKMLGYTDGVTNTSQNSIKSLVPTLTTGAVSYGTSIFMEAFSGIVSSERYTAIRDSKTTVLCGSLDGTIYPVGEGAFPPLHRNCRSYRVPVFKGEGDPQGRISYEAWLKQQPVPVQNEVLGTTKGQLFRKGDLSMHDMLRKDGTPMTLNELSVAQSDAFDRAGIKA